MFAHSYSFTGKQRIVLIHYMILLIVSVCIMLPATAHAANRVYLDLVHAGNPNVPKDTIFIGGEHCFRIWIENDHILGGIGIPFEMYGFGDVGWVFENVNSQFAPATPYGGTFLSGIEGSRWMSGSASDGSCWDLGGTLCNDTLFPSQFLLGGAALYGGLAAGPLEPMLYVHFRSTGAWIVDEIIGIICIDTLNYWYEIIFDPGGYPATNMPRCWPVKLKCGDPTGDGTVNVADVVFMVNYIFRGGRAPDPWQLGDANCDGTVNISDIIFLLKAAFRFGPQPGCP